MTILHLVRNSAYQHNDLALCIDIIKKDDTLVLMDDGCYNVKHPLITKLLNQFPTFNLYIIKSHATARAIIVNNLLHGGIQPISMAELIEHTFLNNTVITWQ